MGHCYCALAIWAGYVGDPLATSVTLVDGWLRTGDICYFDNEGFVHVVDRLKELIKYKGYQVNYIYWFVCTFLKIFLIKLDVYKKFHDSCESF